MDFRPIGIFDSGLGGLSAFRHLCELMPNENLIYLGDTGRVPYGTRSRETIIRYALEDAAFLVSCDVKAILVACNTVSTTAMAEIRAAFNIPFFDVVDAAVKCAAISTKNNKIGVIGTEATVRSGAYGRRIKELIPSAEVYESACPLFVPLVENGRTKPGDIVAETLTEEYLCGLRERGIDTIILGCTHYRLLSDIISGYLGKGVTLVDSGAVAAESMVEALRESGIASPSEKAGERRFCVTDSTDGFIRQASIFLGHDVSGAVSRVSLTK